MVMSAICYVCVALVHEQRATALPTMLALRNTVLKYGILTLKLDVGVQRYVGAARFAQ